MGFGEKRMFRTAASKVSGSAMMASLHIALAMWEHLTSTRHVVGRRWEMWRVNAARLGVLLWTVATAAVLLTSCIAAADDAKVTFAAGMAAARAGDFDAARAAWAPLADAGHAPAQYNLGLMYEQGAGVGQDIAVALDLYRAAAEQDHGLAQYRVGQALQRGNGVVADPAAAVAWFARSAEFGVPGASYELGYAHHEGEGVAPDLSEALLWFWIAARLGYPDAIPARNYTERQVTPEQAAAALAAATAWLNARPGLQR